MSKYAYNIELYDSILKSEVAKLSIIVVVLIVIFTAMSIYSIIEIKESKVKHKKKHKVKKLPYIQLIGIIIAFVFLFLSMGKQIFAFSKDIASDTYVQYVGPAKVRAESHAIFGGVPSVHKEYIISFENQGEYIELITKKDYGIDGDIDNLYIVYSRYSKFILEFDQ